ncbi:hypothetical protein HJG60_010749 [Phyllostomus discolor]|uniref:Uncharacterized protein n=1 Tax=Phyllostomus discolor TaxID=89673 RepID=A0A834EA57_9CHIR|nr:hypothetical protein HJG60_010749 [Phyllostomus discolor]
MPVASVSPLRSGRTWRRRRPQYLLSPASSAVISSCLACSGEGHPWCMTPRHMDALTALPPGPPGGPLPCLRALSSPPVPLVMARATRPWWHWACRHRAHSDPSWCCQAGATWTPQAPLHTRLRDEPPGGARGWWLPERLAVVRSSVAAALWAALATSSVTSELPPRGQDRLNFRLTFPSAIALTSPFRSFFSR